MVTGGSQENIAFAPSGRSLMGKAIGGSIPYEAYDAAKQLQPPILNVNYIVHFVYFGSETE
ncbi:hypothetical protein C0068_10270 [Zhongshania marina]|uniref:Uncharacterized protein n=1 Tax=Zhongshania marina TaxID=2304603 RepID=A0A2S4HFL4_9GAMM|nr:hypothetical protein C0068_10270 [Marortus luteolus]